MFVIEGKAGKSRVLMEHIRTLMNEVGNENDIQIIDYVGVMKMFERKIKYCTNGDGMKAEDFVTHFRKDHKSFQFSKYLVLSLNAPKSMINDLKTIESDFDKKIVVTIQNNELDSIKTYEI